MKPSPSTLPRLLSVREVAALLRVGKTKVLRLCHEGRLDGHDVDGRTRIDEGVGRSLPEHVPHGPEEDRAMRRVHYPQTGTFAWAEVIRRAMVEEHAPDCSCAACVDDSDGALICACLVAVSTLCAIGLGWAALSWALSRWLS